VFEDIGLLDERFFLFWEDVEFSVRARKVGWQVIYCPQSVVYHVRGGTGAKLNDDRFPEIIAMHLGKKLLIRTLVYDFLGILAGLKNNNLSYSRKKLRSVMRFWLR